jgi:hypothetical protein
MRVILSRKGFDSSNGNMPSPILPDGTLLSLPINGKRDRLSFDDIRHDGVAFSDILRQLKGKEEKSNHHNCHMDPDLRAGAIPGIAQWHPAFGTNKAAQGVLRKQGIGVGDLFLFFGWFRQTQGDLHKGTLRFAKGAPDIQVIFGYLQAGEVISDPNELDRRFPWHPHSSPHLAESANNTLYVASDCLSFDKSKPGAGVFDFEDRYVLTAHKETRSKWRMVEALDSENIAGGRENKAKKPGLIQYPGQWQELPLKDTHLSEEWAQKLF